MKKSQKNDRKPKKQDKKGFKQEVICTVLEQPKDLFLFECPNCGGVHFRHAGYVEKMTPFISLQNAAAPEVKSSTDSVPVKLCVNCKHSYIDVLGKFHDITKHINLEAWKQTEIKANEYTGPGGEC